MERLKQEGVPCSPINNIKEVFEDPQIIHRNMKIEVLNFFFKKKET